VLQRIRAETEEFGVKCNENSVGQSQQNVVGWVRLKVKGWA